MGQGHLIHFYTGAFAGRGVTAARVLLTQEDLGDRDRALCVRTTLMRLLDMHRDGRWVKLLILNGLAVLWKLLAVSLLGSARYAEPAPSAPAPVTPEPPAEAAEAPAV